MMGFSLRIRESGYRLHFIAPYGAKRPGQASIDQIVQHAIDDRLSSKRTIKKLQFGYGAPRTIESQTLWIERFNAFRTHTLKQSLDTPFTGDDILRFFDCIIGKVRPIGDAKPGPNETMVITALRILVEYGIFTWPKKDSGFQFTSGDGKRLKIWINDAVVSMMLTRGVWKQRT
jgi:hypothetical protein